MEKENNNKDMNTRAMQEQLAFFDMSNNVPGADVGMLMRDIVQKTLCVKINNEDIKRELTQAGFDGELTFAQLLIYRLFIKAASDGRDSISAFREIKSLAYDAEDKTINPSVKFGLEEKAQRIMDIINEYKNNA